MIILDFGSFIHDDYAFVCTSMTHLVGHITCAITLSWNTGTLCNCIGKRCRYHSNEASNELEVLQVIRVDVGGRVDLQTVVVLPSILKQTVHWVEHLMREQEEPFSEKTNTKDKQIDKLMTLEWQVVWLVSSVKQSINDNKTHLTSHKIRCGCTKCQLQLPGHTPVVQAFLSWKNDPQSPPQILWVEAHDLNTDEKHLHNPNTDKTTQSNRQLSWKQTAYWKDHLLEWVLKQGFTGDVNLNVLRHRQLLRRKNKTKTIQIPTFWTIKLLCTQSNSYLFTIKRRHFRWKHFLKMFVSQSEIFIYTKSNLFCITYSYFYFNHIYKVVSFNFIFLSVHSFPSAATSCPLCYCVKFNFT